MNDRVKEAFDHIHTEEALLDSTKKILYKTIQEGARQKKRKKSFFPTNRRRIPAVLCFLFLLLFTTGYQICFTTAAVISVDVNPSIELNINRLDRVISVKSYNEEGDNLVDTLKVQHMNYTEALEEILGNTVLQKYLSSEEDMISIAVIADDEKKGAQVLADVEACTANRNHTYCYQADQEEVEAAHEAGLSYGKYRAFLLLQELDSSITTEEVKGMSMREIRDWIDELSGKKESDKNNETEQKKAGENGQGQGMGSGRQNGKKIRNGQFQNGKR